MNTTGLRRFGMQALPLAFIVPPIAYLGVFMFWPLARQMAMSLTDAKLATPNAGTWVGLANYERLIQTPAFYSSLRITLVYAALAVVFGVALGVISALAINRPFRGRAIVRAILLFGWAVPNVAAALVWLWMFNDRSGVLNRLLAGSGFPRLRWLTSVDWAFPSVLMVTVWQVAPFVMLTVLAALQSVPEEVWEAARVDGADPLNVFRSVTWPHILPAVQLAALLVAVWSIRRFDIIYLLTGGGPLSSTSTLVVRIRQTAFEAHELGMASAYGAVGLALALAVAAIHQAFDRRRRRWVAER